LALLIFDFILIFGVVGVHIFCWVFVVVE